MQTAAAAPPPPPLPEPPKPVVKQFTIEAGTVVEVRLTDALDSKTATPNQRFRGSLAYDLVANGVVAIPRDSPVEGRVTAVKEAAHFAGSASLSLELTELTVRGQTVFPYDGVLYPIGRRAGQEHRKKSGWWGCIWRSHRSIGWRRQGAAIGTLAGAATGRLLRCHAWTTSGDSNGSAARLSAAIARHRHCHNPPPLSRQKREANRATPTTSRNSCVDKAR